MGSVKDLITSGPGAELYVPPSATMFGRGAWAVKGTYSVKDLKHLIPPDEIPNKAEELTMNTGHFFEWLAKTHPEIPTCYLGVLDNNDKITNVQTLLDRGETTNRIVMKLAHVPETFSGGDLDSYRAALQSGELQCGVADVESIFRKGFPLGSSTFKRIFRAVRREEQYNTLATYDETASALDEIRAEVISRGLGSFPKLEEILQESGLGTTIPNPGFVLKDMTYDSTTKFESTGDREITKTEERKLSGLSDEGHDLWTGEMFPALARAQIKYSNQHNLSNMDGKGECVAYRGMPIVTDFANTPDENRLMIVIQRNGAYWAIPSNKEIQRAVFTQAGVDVAIAEAKGNAKDTGNPDTWKDYFPDALKSHGINLEEVSDHSRNLMAYAIAEVGNRILGQRVFDAKPLDDWVGDFMPYASKIERQE